MRKVFSFLTGIMVGGLVGATIGILLAPASGVELRDQIQERSKKLRDDIMAVAEARRAELERELEALRAPSHKG
ncbi:MAG: YtxH domain-containing protein [Acidobacteriaceae bacterium]